MKPFVKWAGGKRQILERIMSYIDDNSNDVDDENNKWERYVEPFLGGGAVFFNLAPRKAIINDLNSDLINAYEVIKSNDYKELIKELENHSNSYFNGEDKDEYYYTVRALDRDPKWPTNLNNIERAARMIFLNRTCYNGLYRVNSKGQFNTPIGRYNNPLICDSKNIEEIHEYLNNNDIKICNGSYEDVINKCGSGDLIYIDPPYDYTDDDGFTKYQMEGFDFEDFKKLKSCCDNAIQKGATVIISNNATDKVLKLFTDDLKYTAYLADTFSTFRNINCKGDCRKTGYEVIIVGVSFEIVPQANNLDKVINLASGGEEALKDNSIAKSLLGVNTDRQVAYYKSALMFFNYCKKGDEITEELRKLGSDKKKISDDIYLQLKGHKDISIFINDNYSKEEIKNYLMSRPTKLSEKTIERRVSTVMNWIKWYKDYANHNNFDSLINDISDK